MEKIGHPDILVRFDYVIVLENQKKKSEAFNTANWRSTHFKGKPQLEVPLAIMLFPPRAIYSKWRGFYIIFLEACLKTKAIFGDQMLMDKFLGNQVI